MPKRKLNPKEKLIVDLTDKLLADARGYPKKLGRYSCSQLFKMLEAGKLPWGLPAAKFFEIEEATLDGALRMINGTQNHELVQKYLPKERNELKFEYYYYGDGDPRNFSRVVPDYPAKAPPLAEQPIFTLVGKVDHLPDDSVWEIKSSDTIFSTSKDYHDHQAKLYCTICDRPKAYILQPLVEGNRFILKEIGQVERDDEWFAGEMRRLNNYHERVKLLMENN